MRLGSTRRSLLSRAGSAVIVALLPTPALLDMLPSVPAAGACELDRLPCEPTATPCELYRLPGVPAGEAVELDRLPCEPMDEEPMPLCAAPLAVVPEAAPPAMPRLCA